MATPDMTSPATSDRQIEVRKTAKNAASGGCFVSNFSGVEFCLPHQLVGILIRLVQCQAQYRLAVKDSIAVLVHI